MIRASPLDYAQPPMNESKSLAAALVLAVVFAVAPPTWAPIVHGVIGTIQGVSAIMLRQTTGEPMANRKPRQ